MNQYENDSLKKEIHKFLSQDHGMEYLNNFCRKNNFSQIDSEKSEDVLFKKSKPKNWREDDIGSF